MTTPILKDAACDMHQDFWLLSENLVDQCCEMENGQECFNLHVYIEQLTDRIDQLLNDAACWEKELNKFQLDASAIARYLWACKAIRHEKNAYPNTFRGKPILD